MSTDEITQRHLDRLRIRGAPSTIPGTVGFVGSYDAEEVWRQTCRGLVLPLPKQLTVEILRDAFAKLQQVAAREKLQVAEEPLFALKGDPEQDAPHKWEYEAVLPVRGPAKADGELSVQRIDGGMHIATMTPRGLPDLENVYVYLFGKFLPARKQQIMRPYVLHRVIAGLAQNDPAALALSVFVPAVLSIKPVPAPGAEA